MRQFVLTVSFSAAAVLLAACVEKVNVPPPQDEPNAEQWTTAIKTSYDSWQPPLQTPHPNPAYGSGPLVEESSDPGMTKETGSAELPELLSVSDKPLEAEPVEKLPEESPAGETGNKDVSAFSSPQSAGGSSAGSAAVQGEETPEEYIVVEGDSLSIIAKKVYKDAALWPLLYKANQGLIKDQNRILPGMKLKVPKRKIAAPAAAEAVSSAAADKSGETAAGAVEKGIVKTPPPAEEAGKELPVAGGAPSSPETAPDAPETTVK